MWGEGEGEGENIAQSSQHLNCSTAMLLLGLSDLFLIYVIEYVEKNIVWRGQFGGWYLMTRYVDQTHFQAEIVQTQFPVFSSLGIQVKQDMDKEGHSINFSGGRSLPGEFSNTWAGGHLRDNQNYFWPFWMQFLDYNILDNRHY